MNLCDELRYISRVDTQARSLSICSQVMHFIGYGSIHTKLLEAKLQEWSQSMYKTSEEYRKHNGILTRETKEGFLTSTKAYPVYLDLLEKLGLIVFVKEIIRLSKFGRVFVHLTEESQAFLLSDTEKILFLFFLFQRDADALISVMEIVNQGSSNINRIYSTFEEHFKIRLEQKMYFSNTRAKMAISERLRKININYIDSNNIKAQKTMSEKFFVPPRLEWLTDLSLTQEIDEKFSLTYKGQELLNSLFTFSRENSSFRLIDVNNNWIIEKGFSTFASVSINEQLKIPTDLEFQFALKKLLLEAKRFFDVEGAMRISLLPLLIFLSVKFPVKFEILIDYKKLINLLEEGVEVDNKQFVIRSAARINEAYINIKYKNKKQ